MVSDTLKSPASDNLDPSYKFSILIPTWNNLEYLKLCIKSIRENSSYKHQFILHINDGSDGTLDWVKAQPDIEYSHSDTNVGVCTGLNRCSLLSCTDYILYMNDDMYVCPGWDQVISDEIQSIGHNDFFISSTCIESQTDSNCVIEKDYGRNIGSFNEANLLSGYDALSMNDWSGATWTPNIVHKSWWKAVGGYSEEFSPGMYSDPDFSMKLWVYGMRLFIGLGKSKVYHFGSTSVKRVIKNPGYRKFLSKWKMTSGTFIRYYLRRGFKFSGVLPEPVIPHWIKAKNYYKRFAYSVFNSNAIL